MIKGVPSYECPSDVNFGSCEQLDADVPNHSIM